MARFGINTGSYGYGSKIVKIVAADKPVVDKIVAQAIVRAHRDFPDSYFGGRYGVKEFRPRNAGELQKLLREIDHNIRAQYQKGVTTGPYAAPGGAAQIKRFNDGHYMNAMLDRIRRNIQLKSLDHFKRVARGQRPETIM